MAGFKALKGQGHTPTLFMAFLYFDMSFMVWTMLGPLSTEISEALAATGYMITAGEKATLLSLPILSGALLRILLGFGVGTALGGAATLAFGEGDDARIVGYSLLGGSALFSGLSLIPFNIRTEAERINKEFEGMPERTQREIQQKYFASGL